MVSDAETESIFMEPIHLSSAVAAKQIISEGDAGTGWGRPTTQALAWLPPRRLSIRRAVWRGQSCRATCGH